MGDLVPYEPDDSRSYDEQLKDALEKALAIQGTVINDLESAINCIIQMERALTTFQLPNPHEVTARYLKSKYRMSRQDSDEAEAVARKLLREPLKEKPLELTVDSESWCDDCQQRIGDCLCP
jgi:hypothetical protein